MLFTLNTTEKEGFFSVPESIVDDHIRLASGDRIKVLLFILRNIEKDYSAEKIAKKLKIEESEVEDAIKYWEITGVLKEKDVSSAPKKFVPKNTESSVKETIKVEAAAEASSKSETIAPPKPAETSKQEEDYVRPSYAEISTRISESAELGMLFNELQGIMGKTIAFDGQQVFVKIFDFYGLPVDVICTMVGYCISIGKSGYSYIEKVAKTWSEQEIFSLDKATEKIQSLNSIESFWNKFAIATGAKNPKPTTTQIKYLEIWLNEFKFNLEMIVYAYEKAVEATGKPSLPYMNSILKRWNESGYKTINDVEAEEKAKKDAGKAKAGDKTASYDLAKFDEDSLNKKLKYERKS